MGVYFDDSLYALGTAVLFFATIEKRAILLANRVAACRDLELLRDLELELLMAYTSYPSNVCLPGRLFSFEELGL